jgi:uncharacterized protein YacL
MEKVALYSGVSSSKRDVDQYKRPRGRRSLDLFNNFISLLPLSYKDNRQQQQ